MVLVVHIGIALLSLVTTSLTYARPSKTMLRVSYALVVLTLATGTYLVWSLHAPLASTCVTGLIYLFVVAVGLALARRRVSLLSAE